MEMVIEREKTRRRTRHEAQASVDEAPVSVQQASFTPDELVQIMREANTRQSSPAVASIDEALETARELGIDEKHVLEAAREMQEKKIRREALRKRSRAQMMKLVRYLGTMAFVVTLVAIVAGIPTAKLVTFGMGIGAFVIAVHWVKAMFNEQFPPEK